jgi:uncharacterized membrane protein
MKSLNPIRCALCVPVSLLALFASACDGRLAVMDEPGVGGSSQLIEAAGAGGGALAGSGGMAGNSGAGGSGGEAGGTGDPDAGPAPEPTPTCTDQLQNGDETGVDCGGSCAACQKVCDCAATAALSPLGCELASSFGTSQFYARAPRVTSTGDSVAFDICYPDNTCRVFQFSQAAGTRAVPVSPGGAYVGGMSSDGTRVLWRPQVTLGAYAMLSDLEGHATSTGLLPQSALLAANGTAVGFSSTTGSSSTLARKPLDGELEELGSVPFPYANVKGVSADGSTIVGDALEVPGGTADSIPHPFRWTQAGGLVLDLPDLPQTANGASVSALSGDGTVFAGITWQGYTPVDVYRWSAAGGFSRAATATDPDLPGIDRTIMALGSNGATLTGMMAVSGVDFGAFRWTDAGGAVALTPGVQSMGTLLSADGSVLIGHTLDTSDYGAFLWTAAHGTRVIRSTLESAGVDLRGWKISQPLALSEDGRIAIGSGQCGDSYTMYRMVLPE